MDTRHGGRAVKAKDSYVYELLHEFRRGRDAFHGGLDDSCSTLRQKCYSSAKKAQTGN
jgi:hypothetical protein